MSVVDMIASLRHLGLSSVALWPVLMNWRTVVSYVPHLEQIIFQNEHLINNGIKTFLASWYGGFLLAALCAVKLSYLETTYGSLYGPSFSQTGIPTVPFQAVV